MINLHITLTPFRNESRALKEIDSLVRYGITDQVLIAALHEEGLKEYEDIDGARTVWRVKLKTRSWPRNFIVQFLKFLEFCVRVSRYARKNRVQMINIHTLILLPLGVWIKLRHGAKLIYDTHELETERNGTFGHRKKILKLIEHTLIRFADLTIVVGDEIEKWYRKNYGITSIVTVLNCPPYQKIVKGKLLRNEFNIPDRQKIVLYQGGLSAGRGIELLLDAFENTSNDDHVIIFMGYGKLEDKIRKAGTRCSRIYYKSAVAPAEVLQYTASADVGISPIEDTCLSYYYCLPNKLFETIMAGVPVVVSNLPEMRKLVDSYGVGAVMERWDNESIFRALHEIKAMDPAALDRKLKDAARKFSWSAQEEEMIRAYSKHTLAEVN